MPPDETPPSPVVADAAADKAGEARDLSPALPPPGTRLTTFFESSGAKVAIVATIGIALMFAHAYILNQPVSRDALVVAIDGAVFSWLAAFGISKTDTASLRWK